MSDDLWPENGATDSPELDLAALVASRLCHDLINPLGAVGNGLELVEMSNGGGPDEWRLITESLQTATTKVKFFRIAFGRVAGGQDIGAQELTALLAAFSLGGRFRHHWEITEAEPRWRVRLAFLALLCIEPALPRGGDIRVRRGGTGLIVRGEATKPRMEADLWQMLDGAAGNPSPAQVQFALLPRAARAQGLHLNWSLSETAIEITF